MRKRKLLLRRESFGGIFADTADSYYRWLTPAQFDEKRRELSSADNGLPVQVFDATERGYPLLEDATASPISLFLELSKRCNSACRHCFAEANAPRWSQPELSFAQIRRILQQFADIGGFKLRFTGGEPTLREDFFDITDWAHDQGMAISLNTNGLFGEECLQDILTRGIADLRISLDGPERINDTIRGAGSFQRVTRTFERLRDYNRTAARPVSATMNVVLMRANVDCIEPMVELAQSLGAQLSFGLLRLTGRASADQMLRPEEVLQAARRVQQMRLNLALPRGAVRINFDVFAEPRTYEGFVPPLFNNSTCQIGASGLSVDAFGRVAPCGYLVSVEEWTGENTAQADLLFLWQNSDVLRRARRVRRNICTGCPHHRIACNGGCPVMAWAAGNGIDGRDPYCVQYVRASTDKEPLSCGTATPCKPTN